MSPHRFCDVTRTGPFLPVDRVSADGRWPTTRRGARVLVELKATDRRSPFAGIFRRLRHRARGRSVRFSDTPLHLMVRALFDQELRWQLAIATTAREVAMK